MTLWPPSQSQHRASRSCCRICNPIKRPDQTRFQLAYLRNYQLNSPQHWPTSTRPPLMQEQSPTIGRLAHVVPIFKKGDKCKASNYRPVSLTAICSKVMEHILHSNIMGHFEHHSILTDAQHGFRSKRSCETQLITTIQDLASGYVGRPPD